MSHNKFFDQRFDTSCLTGYAPLPFFHSCDSVYLQAIIQDRQLRPQYCNIYKEELLYLFSGKPAYKSNQSKSSWLTSYMPMCFIISFEAIQTLRRVVAFDSGAFSKYSDWMHPSMTLDQFYLTPNKAAILKTVEHFYESNYAYFIGKARHEIFHDPIHFQLESYHAMIRNVGKSDVDDRKSCIEVQLNHAIKLNSTNIEAVILPGNLINSPLVKKTLIDELGLTLIPITNYGAPSPHYYGKILEIARSFMVDKKLMDDK